MELSGALFERHISTKFWMHAENGERVALELVRFQNGHCTLTNEQFSLLFRGGGNTIYPQRTYAVEHEVIGKFDLFLVPVGRDAEGTLYEAVFNRFIKADG